MANEQIDEDRNLLDIFQTKSSFRSANFAYPYPQNRGRCEGEHRLVGLIVPNGDGSRAASLSQDRLKCCAFVSLSRR